MSDATTDELMRKLKEMEARLNASPAAAAVSAPVLPPFQMTPPPAAAAPVPLGFMVPVSIGTPAGEVTAYVQFGPEWAANAAAAQHVIGALMNAGWPVKAWQKQQQGGGNSWGGGGGGGRGRY